MKSEYLENIEKINKCVNFSTENKEKLKQLYYYIYNSDCFQVYYKVEYQTLIISDLDLIFNNDYLKAYFCQVGGGQIWFPNYCFTELITSDLLYRIDLITKDSLSFFWGDIMVFKLDEIKDPFNNIKERVILKERVLNLDLEE